MTALAISNTMLWVLVLVLAGIVLRTGASGGRTA